MNLENWNRWLWVCLGVLTLSALFLARRPLCIDSSVVERIDMVRSEDSEFLLRCGSAKSSAYPAQLARLLPELQRRILRVESALERLGPFQRALRIVILEERPLAFHLQKAQLSIGQELLSAPGHLERALIKAWLRDRGVFHRDERLLEEVAADFYLHVVTGELDLQDPMGRLRVKMGARWPQVIKSAGHYCQSPWRTSEDYETCRHQIGDLETKAPVLSLRPLLSKSLILSWQQMDLASRMEFLRSSIGFFASLRERSLSSESESQGWSSPSSQGLMTSLRSMEHWFHRLSKSPSTDAGMGELVSRQLRLSGVSSKPSSLFFEAIVRVESRGQDSLELADQLAKQLPRPGVQPWALMDAEKIWFLPTMSSFELSPDLEIQSERLGLAHCGELSPDWVVGHLSTSRKLFVVESCLSSLVDWAAWLQQGVKGFAKNQQELPFVQFDLPSFALKKDSLSKVRDLRSWLSRPDVNHPISKLLGWHELQTARDPDVYLPRAVVDAVESFRPLPLAPN